MKEGGWNIIVKEYWLSLDVHIHLHLAIFNSSVNKSLNLNALGKEIESQLKNSYQIKGFINSYQTATVKSGLDNYSDRKFTRLANKAFTVYLTSKYRVITAKYKRLSTEMLLEIKDNTGDMQPLYGKASKIGGSGVDLNESIVQNIIIGADNNTIVHEFGHTLGLLHVNEQETYNSDPRQYWTVKRQHTKDSTNAMFSGGSRYMHDKTSKVIIAKQIEIIIQNYRLGKINLR